MGKSMLIWSKPESLRFSGYEECLKEDNWTIIKVQETSSLRNHSCVTSGTNCLSIFDPLGHRFSNEELEDISKFQENGGCLIIAAGSGSRDKNRRLNCLTDKFKVKFNPDSVIRPNPYKNYHPQEALLEKFVVNRGLENFIENHRRDVEEKQKIEMLTRIIYSNGCTLQSTDKSPIVMMTTSKSAIPTGQTICTFHEKHDEYTKTVVIGSAWVFEDQYFQKENNKLIVKAIIEFIGGDKFTINVSDAKTIDIPKVSIGPDIDKLLDTPISCIVGTKPLPKDKSSLVNRRLFSIDNLRLASLCDAFDKLNSDQVPLTLVKPELERRYLMFEPATHGFILQTLKTDQSKNKE